MRYDPFEGRLIPGTLVRRYKRFLADIELDDGAQITAHCPNSGSMMGMAEPGMRCMVRHVDDPKRKLAWTWELVAPWDGTWVGLNTMRPNEVTAWAVEEGIVPGIEATVPRREVPYAEGSRVDLVADGHYIEVKNTTLAMDGSGAATAPGRHVAAFPDAVTARGAKHMQALADVVRDGGQATVLFFVNRGDCDRFDVAKHIDPTYHAAWLQARDAGVRMLPLAFEPSPQGWRLRGELPVI